MPADPRSSNDGAPPCISPFADAPDAATLTEHARTVLVDHANVPMEATAAAFAHASVSIQGDHTHYSDGFGLLRSIEPGVAVAVAPADTNSVLCAVSEAGSEVVPAAETARTDAPEWAVVMQACRQARTDAPLHVAMASTVPGACRDSVWAALAVALLRALDGLDVGPSLASLGDGTVRDDVLPAVTDAIATATERPYSIAYPMATFAARPPMIVLLDTATREHLPVETDAASALGWALIDTGTPPPHDAAFHRDRTTAALDVIDTLRANAFDGLDAFRDLEHRDLQRALAAVDDAQKPIVRHLVTENRRVQRHVASMRREDWQMIGALLLMSHDSRRTQWECTSAAADRIVRVVEGLTFDGLYGACMTERDGAVLVTGRPPSFPDALQHLDDAFAPPDDRSLRVLRL